ncbi:MAG: hypothetical protein AB7L65_06995 [Hyphomonadaceae bacterium]
MRFLLPILIAAALAACGQTTAVNEAPQRAEANVTADPAVALAATPPPGVYSAISNTAASITGDLTLNDATLSFGRGQVYTTERMGGLPGAQEYAQGSGPLADVMGVPANQGIELRRVTAVTGRASGLCGADDVTFVTLAAGTDSTGMPALWLAAFKGANPPGPNGQLLDLCGVFTYAPASL